MSFKIISNCISNRSIWVIEVVWNMVRIQQKLSSSMPKAAPDSSSKRDKDWVYFQVPKVPPKRMRTEGKQFFHDPIRGWIPVSHPGLI